ncbi:MAG: alpha/beta hydrolase [Caulobacteraceae bacterium]|nr:alpha/beta hydrolase [Caulobacteraceae bacterium]
MGETAGFLDDGGARLAWRRVDGDGPTVVWLGGFRSDMAGTKAQALADWALAVGRAYVRFDYFGHGESSGDFAEGTVTRWRADALAVIDALTEGPLVLVGSSMGAWLACLAGLARLERIAGLALVAPAADFTERLIWAELEPAARRAIERNGVWLRPSAYGDPYPISRALIEDGRRWQILPGPVGIKAPVRILQGGADPDVPWRHALDLALALEAEDLVFTLARDGDHRLSRPQDIARLIAAVEELG